MSDIDDLLNEVLGNDNKEEKKTQAPNKQQKFVQKEKQEDQTNKKKNQYQKGLKIQKNILLENKNSDNIDDLMQDLDWDEPIEQNKFQQYKPQQTQKQDTYKDTQSNPTLSKIKCSPVLVSNESGVSRDSNYSNKKICDKLRYSLIKILFKGVQTVIQKYRYLIILNGRKIATIYFLEIIILISNSFSRQLYQMKYFQKLVKDYSSSAYSCQCSWESVKKTQEVQCLASKKWVCSGHQNQ